MESLWIHMTLSSSTPAKFPNWKHIKFYKLKKQILPQDKMTSPRYMAAARNINDIIPLQQKPIRIKLATGHTYGIKHGSI